MGNDCALLDALNQKLAIVRDRTRGVVKGYSTGFHLYGEGGTSKTFTVRQTLDDLRKPYKVTNSRMTGRGLFDLLNDFPDVVHVLDDVETLFADKLSHGVLRSALWGQPNEPRSIVWQTGKDGRRETVFTGGIVLIANCPLENVPALRALKTRIASVHYAPTNQELAALMRDIASKGYGKLDSGKCLEVANEILQRSTKLERNLDLRLLVNSLQDRLQFEDGQAEAHWTDLLESRLQERVVKPKLALSKVEKEQAIIQAIAHLPREERQRQWEEQTGKSQATLYRWLDRHRGN